MERDSDRDSYVRHSGTEMLRGKPTPLKFKQRSYPPLDHMSGIRWSAVAVCSYSIFSVALRLHGEPPDSCASETYGD